MIKKLYHYTKRHIKIFSSPKNRRKSLIALAIIILIFLAITYFSKYFYYFFTNPDQVRNFVTGFGVWGPIILILIQILQVLIAPIPGQIAGFVSGYIYGVFWGTTYTMMGTIIGSFIAFVLVRKFGRPFVEKVVEKQTLKKFDNICKDKGAFALFLIWLLPALPDDIVCFIAGLTNIRIRTLVILVFLGRLPGFIVLNMAGNGIAVANTAASVIIFGSLMIVSFIIFKIRNRLEKAMIKIITKFRSNKRIKKVQ
ncbi:MAG: TVP38/TMEM64 family protein [Candidatus Woesearchaeota archaeon]|nr:TVP38/TMEM64 family protein [Candidatus Woesearchaeota archaeon]